MCVIEEFDIVHPTGFREPKRTIHYCQWGTPCNNTTVKVTEDRFLRQPETPFPHDPYYQEVEPRNTYRKGTRRARKFSDGLKLVFDFHIPFTSKKTDAKKKKGRRTKYTYVEHRRNRRSSDSPRPYGAPIPSPLHGNYQYPPYPGEPDMAHQPHRPPPQDPPHNTASRVQTIRPRQRHTPNVIHQEASSSSPSPDNPMREHQRHNLRTEAEIREYENLKRHISEQERLRAERDAERVRRHIAEDEQRRIREQERLRAERDAERVRRHNAEDEQWRIREQERLRAERDAERVRRQDAEERRRFRYEARRRSEREERARRRQEQAEWEREQRQLRQEQADWERIRSAHIREDRRRERERLERLTRSNIPRYPRHRSTVHQRPRESFEERGDRVINDAIERRRQFEQRTAAPGRGWPRRLYGGGGRHRRERRVYDDDPGRGGGRFI